MAENTKIEWATHTFNPWVGCTKVSPACDTCYAEAWAKRTGQSALWAGDRRRTSAANWQQPLKWNRQAQRDGTRPRVFCASLADAFDNQVPELWRADLWRLIDATQHLDWLLLTKRPQNAARMLPDPASGTPEWGQGWPNVWLGTTAENQQQLADRAWHLAQVPARVRFLSCEPLLSDLSFFAAHRSGTSWNVLNGRFLHARPGPRSTGAIHWVITGGESGPRARPSHPDWFRSLRDQCAAAGVPFFFKQWGEWAPHGLASQKWIVRADGSHDPMPTPNGIGHHPPRDGACFMYRVGKKAAGRLLDGIKHNGAPGHD